MTPNIGLAIISENQFEENSEIGSKRLQDYEYGEFDIDEDLFHDENDGLNRSHQLLNIGDSSSFIGSLC